MATIKSYTDLEQSKKLAEILSLKSADMFLAMSGILPVMSKYIDDGLVTSDETAIPCWSLAALLDALSKSAYFINEAGMVELSSIKATKWCVSILNCGKIENCYADNPVDTCVEMIIKLHEFNLL